MVTISGIWGMRVTLGLGYLRFQTGSARATVRLMPVYLPVPVFEPTLPVPARSAWGPMGTMGGVEGHIQAELVWATTCC